MWGDGVRRDSVPDPAQNHHQRFRAFKKHWYHFDHGQRKTGDMAATLKDLVQNFAESISALRDFVSLIDPVLDQKINEVSKKHSLALIPLVLPFLDKTDDLFSAEQIAAIHKAFNGTVELIKDASDDSLISIKVSGPDAPKFSEANTALKRASEHKALLYKSSLVTLASNAEWFLSQLIRQHFEAHPESAGIRDKVLTLKELEDFQSVPDARNYLIDLRVDEIMRGSVEDWIGLLKTHLHLSMGYLADPMN